MDDAINPKSGIGLTDGFEGYLWPTEDDLRSTLTSGLVVLDTNVLLNLYRYSSSARDEFLAVLAQIGARIWIPHQVAKEFWRRRESTVRAPIEQASTLAEELEGLLKQAQDRIRHWAGRSGASAELRKSIEDPLATAFGTVVEQISAIPDEEAIDAARDTNRDPVIPPLLKLLEGRVGQPLDEAALSAALVEAQNRIRDRRPPGYKDDKKRSDEDAAGDYLVWEQVLREASDRKVDVLLVTGDVKEDWWRIERGETRGPRPELALELKQRAGTRLFMARPESLVVHASKVLDVSIDQGAVEAIERVDRSQDAELSGGWTTDGLNALMRRLRVEGPVQAKTVQAAVANGGFVSRDEVYEIGNYPESRWLNGFTRPVRRLTRELIDSGVVNPGAVDLLTATYDDPERPFGHASGFVLDPAVLPLFDV